MSSRWLLALALGAASAVAACSSDPSSPAGTVDAGSTPSDAASDTPEDTLPTACFEPEEGKPEGTQCVLSVKGTVVDTSGKPLAGLPISVCGRICFYSTTGEDGVFVAGVGEYVDWTIFAANVHGRPSYAGLYEVLPAPVDQAITLGAPLVLPALPEAGSPIPLVDGRNVESAVDVTSGDVTLKFAAGTEVELDPEDFIDEKGNLLKVAKVDPAYYPTFAKDAGLAVLYAAAPYDSSYTKKVGLEIAAPEGLADGDAVEIVAVGKEFVKSPFTAGKLEVVATGKVAGGKVVTDEGEGLSYLTWIGVRKKP